MALDSTPDAARRRVEGDAEAETPRWRPGESESGSGSGAGGAAGDPPDGPRRSSEDSETADEADDETSALDLTPSGQLLAKLESESAGDRRRLRWTLIVATIFHAALLWFTLPEWHHEPKFVGPKGKVFVMQQVRFQKPPVQAKQRQEIPDPKKKKIPIPDPTPDEPEPLRVEDLEIPDLPPTDTDEIFFGIPEGEDPGFGSEEGRYTGDAFQVGDGILPPVGINKPQPRYTEEARQARIQGVVILSAVIDEEGNVRNLKAIKSLPMGLTESALETVATWTYEPARTAEGKPVAVYYHITVGFWLQ